MLPGSVKVLPITEVIEQIKKIQNEHYNSTTPMDSYFTGMYNGMEVLIACLENRPGNFKSVEQLSFSEIKPQDAVETVASDV